MEDRTLETTTKIQQKLEQIKILLAALKNDEIFLWGNEQDYLKILQQTINEWLSDLEDEEACIKGAEELLSLIEKEHQRLNWTKQEIKLIILPKYGKINVNFLFDEELIDYLHYLRTLT